jgi:hypothetical protein
MVLSLSVSAMAVVTDGNGVKVQPTSANAPKIYGEVTVYLSIISNRVYADNGNFVQIQKYNIPVTLTDTSADHTGTVYHVSDVLYAAKQQNSELKFYSASGYEISGVPTFVYGVKDTTVSNSIVFQPAEYDMYDALDIFYDAETDPNAIVDPDDPYSNENPDGWACAYMQYVQNGWMFRINDQIPLLANSDLEHGIYNGATIGEAYVEEDDIITLYFCDIYKDHNYYEGEDYTECEGDLDGNTVYPTKYLKWKNISYNTNTKTVTAAADFSVVSSDLDVNYFEAEWNFDEIGYNPFTEDVDVAIDNAVYHAVAVNGVYSINVGPNGLSSGTHVISVVPSSELTHSVYGTIYGFNDYVGWSEFIVP